MTKERITQERLKELLHYDPETGIFTWKKTRNGYVKAGSIAGSVNSDGYCLIVIDRKSRKAHRLAWLYMTGSLPADQIDHLNRVRCDNRFSNLQEATNLENQSNRGINRNNKSGIGGVCFDNLYKKWKSRITVDSKRIFLGRFNSFFDACCARKAAENKYN